jgi:hypothetical protein
LEINGTVEGSEKGGGSDSYVVPKRNGALLRNAIVVSLDDPDKLLAPLLPFTRVAGQHDSADALRFILERERSLTRRRSEHGRCKLWAILLADVGKLIERWLPI